MTGMWSWNHPSPTLKSSLLFRVSWKCEVQTLAQVETFKPRHVPPFFSASERFLLNSTFPTPWHPHCSQTFIKPTKHSNLLCLIMSPFILLIIIWPLWTHSTSLVANLTYVLDRNNPNSLPICTIKPGLKSAPCDTGSEIISIKPGQIFQIACVGFGLYQLGTFPCALSREYIDDRCASKFL